MSENHVNEDCGLEGDEDIPVTVGRFNRFARRVRLMHIDRIYTVESMLQKHIRDDELMQAKILGGLVAIKWLMLVSPFLITALVVSIVLILQRSNVL